MRYISTRGEATSASFTEVLLAGLARDGGLYVPENWPQFSPKTIESFAGKPYADVAFEVIRRFVGDAIPDRDLTAMIHESYATFRHPAVAPLVELDPATFVLELFHGPTLAFKDLAMQLLARLMDYALAARGERATIVVATSGDTGGAAIEAFRGRSQVDVVALFPNGRISEVQRRMMTTATDDNVRAVAIEGTFDDCQAIVKEMFSHHAFRDRVRLSGVNSINFARIAAQAVYYFTSAVALGAPHRKIAFTVPTGNFGDVFSGYVAAQMGLPVERLTVATNVNDILVRALETGDYEVREVVPTASPSMDIQISSNFERLLFDAYGRDSKSVRAAMDSLAQSRRFSIATPALAAIRVLFSAGRADEAETSAAIRTTLQKVDYLIDPHTAVACSVAGKGVRNAAVPMVVLATAHPAKFPDAVEAACGIRPPLPDWLGDLTSRPERIAVLPPEVAQVEKFIDQFSRASREGAVV